jgi:hypothetical protein
MIQVLPNTTETLINKRFSLLVLVLIFTALHVYAQNTLLRFMPQVNMQPLVLENRSYKLNGGKDSFSIRTLRFYVSNICFYQDDQLVWKEAESYHLLDVESDQLTIILHTPGKLRYNKLFFNLGIDSMTNAAGAKGGDLDATKGMYWAWQSGYINFKLEGSSPICNTRKNAFEFHLGGYKDGNYCMQDVMLPVHAGLVIPIVTDIASFVESIDLRKENSVMTPGEEAITLSEKAALIFHSQGIK